MFSIILKQEGKTFFVYFTLRVNNKEGDTYGYRNGCFAAYFGHWLHNSNQQVV